MGPTEAGSNLITQGPISQTAAYDRRQKILHAIEPVWFE